MYETAIATPLGTAHIKGDENGIAEIRVGDGPLPDLHIPPPLQAACTQLKEYFEGARKTFDLPLQPDGTPFQRRVWGELLKIPYGTQVSYLDLARNLGDPGAVRAVASANAKNPVWIVIPCHRVVGSDGNLKGYAGGLHRKKWLLDLESPSEQLVLFS
jgi:methylated-DNA-[protein]-cysteine S-methyltransferase